MHIKLYKNVWKLFLMSDFIFGLLHLQEKLEKLSQENAELRDLCLFLNQMSNTTTGSTTKANHSTTSDPKQSVNQSGPYAVHAACVTDVNATLSGEPPQYSGFTGEAKLADNKQDVEPSNKEEEAKKCKL